jgi:hypothetical protein
LSPLSSSPSCIFTHYTEEALTPSKEQPPPVTRSFPPLSFLSFFLAPPLYHATPNPPPPPTHLYHIIATPPSINIYIYVHTYTSTHHLLLTTTEVPFHAIHCYHYHD